MLDLTDYENTEWDCPGYLCTLKRGELEDDTTLYALKVLEGEIVAGPHVRKACRRHLRDLAWGWQRGLQWDPGDAKRVFEFYEEVLKLADKFEDEEKTVPASFRLELWQKFIVGSLFGWKGPDGHRRFRTGYVEIGKGNGKTPLVGGMGLYMLTADGEAAPECYAGATKLEQAKIMFRDAERMVDASPVLSGMLDRTTNNIAYVAKNGFFRPISSEKRGLDGPRVHFGALDELHEHRDAVVADKLRAGTKGRTQSLIVEITNSGHDRTSVCWAHHEYSLAVLDADVDDKDFNDTWFAYVCALDEKDDWEKDESCWMKANPNLGISVTVKYLREQVNEARGMPSKRSIVARLNFCEWVGAENPWISPEKWFACERKFDSGELLEWMLENRKYPCYGGLDLSTKKDLTAFALVWKLPDRLRARVWFWTPEATMDQRGAEDKVPYRTWVEQGFVEAVPGSVIDYPWPALKVMKLNSVYGFKGIAFDPHRIEDFTRALDEKGASEIVMVKHAQGFMGAAKEDTLWMPRSVELIEKAVLREELEIVYNPCLRWNSASAILVKDEANNRKWDKRKATGRIDGLVALCQAVGLALAGDDDESEESLFETMGLGVMPTVSKERRDV